MIRDFLPLVLNLEELFLIVDYDKVLSSKIIQRITKSINSKKFRNLILDKLSTSKSQLKEILQPFKVSIKKITLKNTVFTDNSLIDFINYWIS